MERFASGALLDLLAATESVSEQQRIRWRGAHARKQDALRRDHRYAVFFGFEPERARHAAAAGRQDFAGEAEPVEHAFFRCRLDHRVMMTMDLYEGRPGCAWQRLVGRMLIEEFGEEKSLRGEALCRAVVRKETGQFIAKRADAGGFETDNGRAPLDVRSQRGHDVP